MSSGTSERDAAVAGRSALVTGAASGIGLAIARRLAAEGAPVMGRGDADRPVPARTRPSPGMYDAGCGAWSVTGSVLTMDAGWLAY